MEEELRGLPSFGSKYNARRAELRERIRNNAISCLETTVEEEAFRSGKQGFTCYFCGQRISGMMRILEDIKYVKKVEGTIYSSIPVASTYYIHDSCYHDAMRFQYESISDSKDDEIRLGLN